MSNSLGYFGVVVGEALQHHRGEFAVLADMVDDLPVRLLTQSADPVGRGTLVFRARPPACGIRASENLLQGPGGGLGRGCDQHRTEPVEVEGQGRGDILGRGGE
ncbi:hypothetical protein [Peterkaempfera griseoplana]|uniref:hypothetical protein n=1 Tax=Peterkaempfera griseoplana TaxID=66896 RepID=UPI0006E30273|nr:hypothetical protein [Peterkaempfera griseoplana]